MFSVYDHKLFSGDHTGCSKKSRRMYHFCFICFSSRCFSLYDCGSIFSIFCLTSCILIVYFGKQTNKFRGNMFFNVSQTNFYKVYVRNLICKNIYKISKWRSKISKTFDRSEFINTGKKDPCRLERMETFSVYYLTK